MCRVIGIKLKHDPQSYKWKNYYWKKVWTVNASDIEWAPSPSAHFGLFGEKKTLSVLFPPPTTKTPHALIHSGYLAMR
jgi:hypothetical protein